MDTNYTRARKCAEAGNFSAAIAFALLALVEAFDDEDTDQ